MILPVLFKEKIMTSKKRKWTKEYFWQQFPLHAMLFVPCLFVLIYHYFPFIGILMAFQRYVSTLDGFLASLFSSKFVGLDVFRHIFKLPNMGEVIFNTIFIAVMKIVSVLFFPVVFALMLNEVYRSWFKRTVQVITFLPYFLSWVVLRGIFFDVFSPRADGIVNQILGNFGVEPINFFGNSTIFPYMMVATNLWQQIGYNTIIILAAISGIDPTLYEAATIDGAKRLKQMFYVTLPSIAPMVLLMAILSLGNVLRAGFDQIFNMYSPSVYKTGDILDTFVYRLGIMQGSFSNATAVGLFQSAVSMVLIVFSYWLAHKYSDYKIF